MGEDTREFECLRARPGHKRLYSLFRERGYYVLYNLLTRRKRFYSRLRDVRAILERAGGTEK